ncbi:MAG: alpha-1,2-fucosyltransferase [Lewinella sp.]
MVIVRFKGGMGNQMFQYAFGRQLAADLDTELVFDPTNLLYRNNPPDFVYRNYDLDVFRPTTRFMASPKLLAPLFNLRVEKLGQGIRWLVTRGYPVVKEPHFHFAPEVFSSPREGVIYDGWWQSSKYFAREEARIRNDFRFSREILPASTALLQRIEGSNAICLNVRRTDFLKVDTLNATDLNYFLQAADHLGKALSEPRFFIFSDDVEWCRENLQLDYPMEVVGHEHKGWKFGNYLQLMTRCKHFIIPNSSFAWWATWLNIGPDKMVVAPKNWFTDPKIDTSDLVPEEWLRM